MQQHCIIFSLLAFVLFVDMSEYCECRRLVVVRTAWTERNAGRRFVSCYNGKRGCKYFRWVDAPICDRGWEVISGLRRRIDTSEEEMERLKGSQQEDKFEEMGKSISSCCNLKMMFVCFLVLVLILSAKSVDEKV